MSADVLEKLRRQDWDAIGRVLVAHVIRRSHLRAWREGTKLASLGLGRAPEDIVQDVITKVFAGERTWDPERGELVPTLKRIVESELDHLWKAKARRVESRSPDDPELQATQESHASEIDPDFREPGAEEVVEEAETWVSASTRVGALFAAVEGEPDLQAVLEAIMEGCEPKPRYLAEHLQVPVQEIYSRMRRLRQRAKQQVT